MCTTSKSDPSETKLYKFRWFILTMYCMYAASSSLQWIQYCIISKQVMKFYNISVLMVDWTSLVSMVTYFPLVVPASYIIERMGLRTCALLGVLGTALGTWIKVFSVKPHLFYLGFAGQAVIYLVQNFILSLPPRLSSVWFGADEASTACALGVFGTQLGTAIGFIIPPLMVADSNDIENIGNDLWFMFLTVAVYTSLTAVLVLIFFRSEPTLPPSTAQLRLRAEKTEFALRDFLSSYKKLITYKPFVVLMIAYGVNIAVYNAICTLLNQYVINYFPESVERSGSIGTLMVVVGMMGSIVFGWILDKTKKFKAVTFWIYVSVTLSLTALTIAFETRSLIAVYATAALLGFFQSAYYAVGFELATELTFPAPEYSSSGLLVSMSQTLGIIVTLLMSDIFYSYGALWSLLAMIILCAAGSCMSAFTPNIKRRQEALYGTSTVLVTYSGVSN